MAHFLRAIGELLGSHDPYKPRRFAPVPPRPENVLPKVARKDATDRVIEAELAKISAGGENGNF